jgi:hypothetical protein
MMNLKKLSSSPGANTFWTAIGAFSLVHQAQHLLFRTIYELEPRTIDILRKKFPFSVTAKLVKPFYTSLYGAFFQFPVLKRMNSQLISVKWCSVLVGGT